MTKVLLGAAVAMGAVVWSGPEGDKSDLEAIKQTALDYGQGWYEGNADRMERALHADLAKRVLMPDPRSGKGKLDHLSALGLVMILSGSIDAVKSIIALSALPFVVIVLLLMVCLFKALKVEAK